MALNAPYTPNTVIQSTQVSNDLVGLANGSNDTPTNSMSTFRSEATFDFVASGCIWSGDSYGGTRNASMTAGVVYIGGVRLTVALVTGRLFTASKDTYIDSNNSGVLVYTEVTNNAASPALAANSLRIGIIITGASNIANSGSVNQGQETKVLPIASSIAYSVTDSLGNLIYPADPQRKLLGFRQAITNQGSITTAVDMTGLSCPVIIPANRKVTVSGFIPAASNSTGGAASVMNLLDATASLQLSQAVGTSPAANSNVSLPPSQPYTAPASGARTFKAQVQVSAGGTMSTNASSTAPGWIRVELE